MKGYILTSISNRLLKNKRSEALYEILDGFYRFYFTEENLEEFLVWIDTTLSALNKDYPRMKPLTISAHPGGVTEMFWVAIKPEGAYTENQFTLAFTRIMGQWNKANLFNNEEEK